jgi:xanthine dehydrogenase molybdenum-binding subunit
MEQRIMGFHCHEAMRHAYVEDLTMTDDKLIGRNYTTPDLVAKVTGRAKYSEDFRADGMLFVKLLLSPMPHARVTRLDTREAAAMPGVRVILTADDLPQGQPRPGVVEVAQVAQGPALTNEPVYEGEPILAVAAESELIAAEAIERIHIEFEPLPFVVDALASLRPDSPNARTQGNVWARLDPASPEARGLKGAEAVVALMPRIKELKWTEHDFAAASDGQLPMGEATDQWSLGDVDEGF